MAAEVMVSKHKLLPKETDDLASKKIKIMGDPEEMAEGAENASCLSIDEALEFIFQYLDLPNLKICRFVCKKWNHEACFALRKRVVISFYDRKNFDDFFDLASDHSDKMPSPFQHLRIHTLDQWYREDCKDKIQDLTLTMLGTEFGRADPKFPIILDVLQSNSAALRELELTDYDVVIDYNSKESDKTEYSFHFPELEVLEVAFADIMSGLANLVIQIINSSPKLKQIRAFGICLESVLQVFTGANLSHIEKLELVLNRDVFSQIAKKPFRIPKLHSLHLQFMYEDSSLAREGRDNLYPFLSNFASSLRCLEVSFDSEEISLLDSGLLTLCPNLTCIDVKSACINGPHDFPKNLGAICVEKFYVNEHEPLFTKPCEQVKHIKCFNSIEGLGGNLELGILLLERKFPYAKTWELGCCLLSTCLRNLPNLKLPVKKLRLYDNHRLDYSNGCDLTAVLTGYRKNMLSFVEQHNLMPEMFGSSNIQQNFEELNELVVDVVHDNVNSFIVKHGFAKMKNLKMVGFRWDFVELEVSVLMKWLTHLEKIYLFGCCKSGCSNAESQAIFDLYTNMSNVYCACSGFSSIL